MGKTGRKNKVYSAEFKIGVIMDMREHHLSYHETVRRRTIQRNGQEMGTHILGRRSRRSDERKTRQKQYQWQARSST